MYQAVVCDGVVTDTTILSGHAVLVRDGVIAALCRLGEIPSDHQVVHVKGAYLAPGLIDIHVHGALGRSWDEADPEAGAVIGEHLLRAGITTALPTLVSAPVEQLCRTIPVCLAGSGKGRPWLPGVQLEGPYLSPAQAGAHDPAMLRLPDDGSDELLLEVADQILILCLAPELPGALDLVRRLAGVGVVVAAGHSDATAEDLARAVAAGVSHVTHVFSGQSVTRREGPWRVPGMLEGTLTTEGITVEVIADGRHLPDLLLRLAHRCLGDRMCAVSDASPGTGLPDGATYDLGSQRCVVENGVGVTEDRRSFGGSTTMVSEMLPVLRRALSMSIPQVLACVTSIPARAARLERVGRMVPGYDADLVVLDEDLHPLAVALRGRWQNFTKGDDDPTI